MKPLRLVLVTRRFWPLVGGAEVVMANLAAEFFRQGASPVVLTAQWHKSWPQKCVMGDVPLIRLPQPARRGWGSIRYMIALTRWLKTHVREIDLVYVSMLKHDAYTSIGSLAGTNVPIVLRAEGGGQTGDCQWQQTIRFGRRIKSRCLQADALVAISPAIESELVSAGYSRDIIHRIQNGVKVVPEVHPSLRWQTRVALEEVNPDLAVPSQAPLAVYTGRLHSAKGLEYLIKSWPRVLDHWPTARLWLIGEGNHRSVLEKLIRHLGLTSRIFLPGVFDPLDDVLKAANLFILPSFEEGMSIALLEAMSYGLPCVVTDILGNRAVLGDDIDAAWVPPGNTNALAQTIIQLWKDPNRCQHLGLVGRDLVKRRFGLEQIAQQHLEIFEHLVAKKI